MELPFAIDSPNRATNVSLHSNSSSLVTASSQGSFVSASTMSNNNINSVATAVVNNDIISPSGCISSNEIPNIVAPPTGKESESDIEEIDFTYVTVCELDADEVDVVINGAVNPADRENYNTTRKVDDVLTVLMREDSTTNRSVGGRYLNNSNKNTSNEEFVKKCEEANAAAMEAIAAKENGDLQAALDAHSKAAREFRNAAIAVRCRSSDSKTSSIASSLLLSCKSQARSALALKRIIKRPNAVVGHLHQKGVNGDNGQGGTKVEASDKSSTAASSTFPHQTQKDRLRETVRGALDRHNEADISDSVFLGTGRSDYKQPDVKTGPSDGSPNRRNSPKSVETTNPVDDVMELEKVLRDMDMALKLGNSIASIASISGRAQNSRANQLGVVEGSFCVVPPGASSVHHATSPWSSFVAQPQQYQKQHQHQHKHPSSRAAAGANAGNVRARSNRVQNTLDASIQSTRPTQSNHHPHQQRLQGVSPQKHQPNGLESSWWGNASVASHAVLPTSAETGVELHGVAAEQNHSTNTKQVMRLLDSVRTLSEENAALLRELEDAEAARAEARAAREQMKRFKADYDKRFSLLKAALEKFRKQHHTENVTDNQNEKDNNPVITSNYMRLEAASEEMKKKDQLIRKLTSELKKEREESKKKDLALRKYEDFYRQVKARSAQKAAQKQREVQQQQRQQQDRSKLPPSRAPR